jgi:sarcosine oxidase
MFDVAVIGIGMIGSAALRYLSEQTTGLRVVGIGPAEPVDWSNHQGAFASHYDQARITRVADPDPIWATLAQRAMGSYGQIEQRSHVTFHYPVGHLRITPQPAAKDDRCSTVEMIGRRLGAQIERLDGTQLHRQFPYLNLPTGAEGIVEAGGAGYINPRALVTAQLTIAAAQGARIVRAEVSTIAHDTTGFALRLNDGQLLHARRVLVSAHGYTNMLLEPLLNHTLELVNMAHTTVYAQVAPDAVHELGAMPSVICSLVGHPVLESVYTTPPMTYPDGRVYLKIGGPLFTHPTLQTPEAIRHWTAKRGSIVSRSALASTRVASADSSLPQIKPASRQRSTIASKNWRKIWMP